MARKADKDATTQIVLNLVGEAEQLKKQIELMKSMAKNQLQPPPELVEVDAMINQDKVNEEVAPDEIQITLTGNPQLAACGGSYIKYYVVYEEGKQFEGHF